MRVRVRSTAIQFGNSDYKCQLASVNQDEVLNEGDVLRSQFSRSVLVEAAKLKLKSDASSLLFVHIKVVGRRPILRVVRLPAFEDATAGRYAPYIAANVYLGLGVPLSHIAEGRSLR
jgi:hypothetical protein